MMYVNKSLVLVGVTALAAVVKSQTGCDAPSVVTVIIDGPTVTETIGGATSAVTHPHRVEDHGPSTTTLQTTVTNFHTVTQILSLEEPITAKDTSQGPYLFHVASGSTLWLSGNTPPNTGSFVTAASTITVQPAPSEATTTTKEGEALDSFGTTTLTSTSVFTDVLTLISLTPSAKLFTGLALHGWNSSLSVTHRTATGRKQIDKEISTKPMSYAIPTGSYQRLAKRQEEQWITATIEGAVVSWINRYTPTSVELTSATSATQESLSTTISLDIVEVAPSLTAPASAVYTTAGAYAWSFPGEHTTLATSVIPDVPSFSSSMVATLSALASENTPPFPSPRYTSRLPMRNNTSVIPTTTGSIETVASETCTGANPTFTINFDDLPHFAVDENQTAVDVPPIFNPYRKMWWDDHFGYVPPPTDPYLPHSGNQLAVWRYANENVDASPDAGLESPGEFGAGPRESDSAYWIDGISAWLGCENGGPVDCTMYINGYVNGSSTLVAHQIVTISACPGGVGCHLQPVIFGSDFRGLDGIQILAAVGEETVSWFMDDLVLAWSNNTCEAQSLRASHQ